MKQRRPYTTELLNNIDKNGLSNEDLVIGLRSKEREIKEDARLFALNTIKSRMYFVTTEKLIADHMIRFFLFQTMEDSSLKLIKTKFISVKLQTS